jgi:aminoglycoside/hydroxyurea antibiotic resistance kinase
VKIPERMAWWLGVPGGEAWLQALPRLASECAQLWSLRLGSAFEGSNMSLVLLAETDDGTPSVLKLSFPGGNGRREAEALAWWNGTGAVRLLDAGAYDAASLLRDRRWAVKARSLGRRLDALCAELEVDRERVRRWGIVHALTWGVSVAKAEEDMLLTARLLRG